MAWAGVCPQYRKLSPNDRFDFAVSAGYNDSTLRSTVTSTAPDGTVSVVSGIKEGNRFRL
jgi:hypothetical protein